MDFILPTIEILHLNEYLQFLTVERPLDFMICVTVFLKDISLSSLYLNLLFLKYQT